MKHRFGWITVVCIVVLLFTGGLIKAAYAQAGTPDTTNVKLHIQDTVNRQTVSLQAINVISSRYYLGYKNKQLVPIDILSRDRLLQSGYPDLGHQLQALSPSFNSARYGINGSLGYTDYATLRGMGPDQLLVLLNGKRRHQFSIPHIGFSISRGTVVTDLNTIPALAIESVEVMRDGASAVYGSDAIAGIINLRLSQASSGGVFRNHVGVTHKGDGLVLQSSFNQGFKLGKEGSYLNYTVQFQKSGHTDRSDLYTGRVYSKDREEDSRILAERAYYPKDGKFRVGRFGNPDILASQFFVNTGYPLPNNWFLYAFGGYSHKRSRFSGIFRDAIPGNAYSNPEVFPNGFTPEFPATDNDYSAVAGIRKKLFNKWNADFSLGYGRNAVDRYAENSTNASLGAMSPRNFYVGSLSFSQLIAEANITRHFRFNGYLRSLQLSFGGQHRTDYYKMKQGEPLAFARGPIKGKTPGVQGLGGTSPQDEVDRSRFNLGVYADAEMELGTRLLLGAAVRQEYYEDFGGNISGKISSRFAISKKVSVRGSVNRGFRAPGLQQLYNSASTSIVRADEIRYTRQLRSDDPLLARIGINDLAPEVSWNYNIGVLWRPHEKLHFSVDAYQVNVKNRIVLSEALDVPAIYALREKLHDTGIQQISFFTNQLNTRTRGLDVMGSFNTAAGKGKLKMTLAVSLNRTGITGVKETPKALQEGTTSPVKVIDTIMRGIIEGAQPRGRGTLMANYSINRWGFEARACYYGKAYEWSQRNKLHVQQTYGSRIITDVSVQFAFTRQLNVSLIANNLFSIYPDKPENTSASYSFGQTPYSRIVNQFGYNGAYYAATLAFKF